MTRSTWQNLRRAAAAVLALTLVSAERPLDGATAARARSHTDDFGPFVEPGFPFITTTIDARTMAASVSTNNVTVRCVALVLGDETYACFDPDLLRMSLGWSGNFVSMNTMAQISYHEAGNKNNAIPTTKGEPIFGNGIYAGWDGATPTFRDPRPAGPNPDEVGRGPLAERDGLWRGIYVVGNRAVLSYRVRDAEIFEQPGVVHAGAAKGIVRSFMVGPHADALTLAVAEVPGGATARDEGGLLFLDSAGVGSATGIGVATAPVGARLIVHEGRHVAFALPPSDQSSRFTVVVWRGAADQRSALAALVAQPAPMAEFRAGTARHWKDTVQTVGRLSTDTGSYVADELTLPLTNPWRRNVRVAGLDFFPDGRAATVTFDGDVWIVSGIDRGLRALRWTRFASGLYEPLSVQIVDGELFVFGREGIVRLRDLNNDGEADFYESFNNTAHQSIESREYPLDMVKKPGGGFYLAKGSALDNGPQSSKAVRPGFRIGSKHAGSVLEVSADGKQVSSFATGLREPFIGVHSGTGMVTASDQQGNFVPSTPIYALRRGGYFGVPVTAHSDSLPAIEPAVVWIPHPLDPSGAGQKWIRSGKMGMEGDALIHLSYGSSIPFRVYLDSTSGTLQGAVVPLRGGLTVPVLKAAEHPLDGQLYLTGFRVWGAKVQSVSGFTRLRYTGVASSLPLDVRAGTQGVYLRFPAPLDPASIADTRKFSVLRWNYARTERYGSGNFLPNGQPGREAMAVAAARLSADRRGLLLLMADMSPIMQMEVQYAVRDAKGRTLANTIDLTVNKVSPLPTGTLGFGALAWERITRDAKVKVVSSDARSSAAAGRDLYQKMGCMGCHSVDGTREGKVGPTFKALWNTRRSFVDGTSAIADSAYIRRSILTPSDQIVAGYPEGMPSFNGMLNDAQIASLVLYIQSLRNR